MIQEQDIALYLAKKEIGNKIKQTLHSKGLTYRKACEDIHDLNYTQLSRVTSGTNYTIDTLLKALDGLGLKVKIEEK